jgi:hypothetical protein
MGRKFSYILVLLLNFSYTAKAQEELNFQFIDTLTYYYYEKSDWENLIKSGNEAVEEGIDYKYLRQRLGYAYFVSGDYIRSARNFEKALQYDSYDPFTLGYLYYSNLNLLRPESAGVYSSRMTSDKRKEYQIKSTKIVESIDFELNAKIASTTLRSDTRYIRLGLCSRPLNRLSLYQSVSGYNQQGAIQYPTQKFSFQIRQFGYYGLIRYAMFPHLNIKAAYHFLYSDFSSSVTYSNMGYAALSANYDIFTLSVGASAIYNTQYITKQGGLKAGINIPGNRNLSLTAGIFVLNQQDTSRLIFSGSAGIKLNNKVRMTADLTYGYQNYYNDFDALYVYNSIDPITFRTCLTTYYLTSYRLTLWINMGFERKEYFENNEYNYNQISLLGGVQWRF